MASTAAFVPVNENQSPWWSTTSTATGPPSRSSPDYIDGDAYPINLRHDLLRQLPSLKRKFLKYDSYHSKTVAQIFEPSQLAGAEHRSVTELRSGWAENLGGGRFEFQAFGWEAQLSPVFASVSPPSRSRGSALRAARWQPRRREAGDRTLRRE